jgi:nicotinamide riboside kinase
MNKTKVVNFFGSPSSGKSTTASLLFGKLKQAGVNCELVQEYAKDKTWEGSFGVLQNQLLILGKQSHRQFRCRDQVDLIITDSPLLLSLHYAKHLSPEFKEVVRQTFNEYDNFNYLVERGNFAYNPIGRSQSEAEAQEIHLSLKSMLLQEVNNCKTIRRGEIDLPIIVEDILSVIK